MKHFTYFKETSFSRYSNSSSQYDSVSVHLILPSPSPNIIRSCCSSFRPWFYWDRVFPFCSATSEEFLLVIKSLCRRFVFDLFHLRKTCIESIVQLIVVFWCCRIILVSGILIMYRSDFFMELVIVSTTCIICCSSINHVDRFSTCC